MNAFRNNLFCYFQPTEQMQTILGRSKEQGTGHRMPNMVLVDRMTKEFNFILMIWVSAKKLQQEFNDNNSFFYCDSNHVKQLVIVKSFMYHLHSINMEIYFYCFHIIFSKFNKLLIKPVHFRHIVLSESTFVLLFRTLLYISNHPVEIISE
jgi:hypothetical protein